MIAKLLKEITRPISKFHRIHIARDPRTLAHRAWKKDILKTGAQDRFDLDREAVVFDVGGYVGDFSAMIRARYDADCYLFEPAEAFLKICKARFEGDAQVRCFPFGLSGEDETVAISADDDGSSTLRETAEIGEEIVELKAVDRFIKDQKLSQIDLMKLNIEGGEYSLLDRLLETGLADRVDTYLIQFHDFLPDSAVRRDAIREGLEKTHDCVWNYEFVWEKWVRKPG